MRSRRLSAANPENAHGFKVNAARYSRELHDLDGYAHARSAPIPPQQRKILTSHDAFGYLGRDYGLTFLSPLGLSLRPKHPPATSQD